MSDLYPSETTKEQADSFVNSITHNDVKYVLLSYTSYSPIRVGNKPNKWYAVGEQRYNREAADDIIIRLTAWGSKTEAKNDLRKYEER